uniref:non-specific serine/threonine protein kinase n=1 Tax=Timspurckia oligopyrenoides TaxID=708627 RepID=A0A6T6MRT9_9RHOD|mmetsp:Transcript_6111/g.10843  ORF Transcript_6111/g.10843 Transcript_6111/m.10843 type:complete len:456 (+) Transcript_6111:237-1604(+)|eukprot:CAMPEP_0182442042 /NCGR_PEP_ID=MMETSP1172-20130603/1020_1 /TAXON_ID=708627 /ORGANISM="Timspurckia oligopyrenoides, Strain CCMP3278" /LENGTH=455 /DNA_ID=CAMNT_0024636727 /DNA_START=206 /DNA_END=1576 /DNA_ORIENTATION=-
MFMRSRPSTKQRTSSVFSDRVGQTSLSSNPRSSRDEVASEPGMYNRYSESGSVKSTSSRGSLQVASVGYTDEFPVTTEVGAHLFKKLKKVGRGGVGTVYLAQLRDADPIRLYAIKEIDKQDMLDRNKVKRVMTEREIFATSNHPFIISMYASFQTKDKLFFVMEYAAGGEFFKYLQRRANKRLSEEGSRIYAAEVLLALEYLHQMGFVYRDLKPENVMMRQNGHIALTDFDLSKLAIAMKPRVVEKSQPLTARAKAIAKKTPRGLESLEIVSACPVLAGESNSFVGTEEYIAPEIVKGDSQTVAVDFWSFGILIYEMICGTTPFKGKEQKDTFDKIVKGDLKFPDNVLISKDAKSIIRGLLTKDPAKRLGTHLGSVGIKNHNWFKGLNFALIRNMDAPIRPDVPDPYDLSQYKPLKNDSFSPISDSGDQSGTSSPQRNSEFAAFDTVVDGIRTKY